ncbi:MAG: inorganic diphosphatase [Patescibacteria group bacterium]|nr:inorganic diphosphatase [Patescibacteria group bacterium]
MNLWRDIDPGSAEEMIVVTEIPRSSNNKYEVDKETGLITLDRVLHSAQVFPFDYGFVPKTLWDDGDALDVMLLATNPFPSGILVKARPVGLIRMTDSGDNDDKVLAVPVNDPRWSYAKDLGDINKHTLREIEHFYSTYKKLQNKEVVVSGFAGVKEAKEAFERARSLYSKKFSN